MNVKVVNKVMKLFIINRFKLVEELFKIVKFMIWYMEKLHVFNVKLDINIFKLINFQII